MLLSKKEIFVLEEEANIRIDIFLSKKFRNISRILWQKRIQKQLVLVNNKPIKKSYILKKNDKITFYYPKKPEPEINKNFKILYEDEFLIVIDKPANLPIHPSGNYKNNTLNFLLKEYLLSKKEFYCHPIHRIDKETSGLVLYGKNPEFIKKMNFLFRTHQIQKRYLVIVFGKIQNRLLIEGFIGKDLLSKIKRKQIFIPKEKIQDFINSFSDNYYNQSKIYKILYQNQIYTYRYCKTLFEPIKIKKIDHTDYEYITLLEVKLFTGRFHQIRATLKSLNYPIVGDKIYGIDENYFLQYLENPQDFSDRLLLNRTALHSYSLEWEDSFQKKHFKFFSPLPEDIKKILEI